MNDGFEIPKRTPRKGMPVLKGFVKNSQLHVWCPFCVDWHHHGAKDGHPAMFGHRVAHCHRDDSPLRETGYYIRPFTEGELKKYSRRHCAS